MRDLRRAAVVAGLLGQLAAAVAGVLPWPLLPVAAVGFVVAAQLSRRADERRAKLLRGIATAVSFAFAIAVLPRISAERDALRSGLGLLLVAVQVAHALSWRARRDLDTALAIAGTLLVLGASFAPDILVGLPLLAGWAAVVAGAVLSAAERSTAGTVGLGSGGRRPALVPVTALALLLGLAAFLLVPVSPTPAQRNPLAAIAAAAGISGSGRGNTSYSSDRLDLRVRGSLSERPVLDVPADSPDLWRSGLYGVYNGSIWGSTRLGRQQAVPGPPWRIATADGATRTDRAVLRGPSEGTVWAPGEPLEIDADQGPSLSTDGRGTVRTRGPLRSYTVQSDVQELDPTALRRAVGAEAVSSVWLQLPPSLPDRVRELSSQLTSAAPTRYDAVRSIEDWLRGHATYQLDSPVPLPGEDAVDRFLFVDRTGFCEQFAAAETVLLRAAGIPARLATGLSVGVPADPGRRLYREKDLHAWVEVLYPGAVGWTASDPTAGVPLAGGGGVSLRLRLSTFVTRQLHRAEGIPGGRPALALLLGLIAVGVVVLARLYRPRVRTAPPAAERPVRAGPALAAFLRYDPRLGARRRRPSESLAELAARLGPEEAAALAVVEAECYAATPPSDVGRAVAVLDRLPAAKAAGLAATPPS